MELITWIGNLITAWGENTVARGLGGWTTASTRYADPELWAGARLTPDYDTAEGTRALEIQFKRRGPGRRRERYLYVKFAPTERRLDHPRVWRTLGRLPKSRSGRRHRRLGQVEVSRILYWHHEIPPEDIRAQISIALVQLNLVSTGTLVREVVEYVRSFRRHVPIETARDVAIDLFRRFSFPEDFRSFRKYVSKRLRLALRQQQVVPATESPVRKEDLHWRIRDAETAVGFNDEDGELEDSGKSTPSVVSRTAEWMTVEDAAVNLDLSPSYIYKLIKRGGLRTDVSDGRVKVRKEDIDHILGRLGEKQLRRQVRDDLVNAGVKYETARKRVYRKNGPLPA